MLSIGANEVWFYVIVTWEQITATAPAQRHDTQSGSYDRVAADQKTYRNHLNSALNVIFKATWRRLGGNCGFKLNGSG